MHRSIAHAIVIAVTLALLPNADAAGRSADSKPREIKIKGYVTNVTSPTQFEIEDYRITRDRAFVLEFENESPELRFRPEDIKVGVELEIKGYLDEATNTLRPTSIKVDLDQFKKGQAHRRHYLPACAGDPRWCSWTGTFVADGQRIQADAHHEGAVQAHLSREASSPRKRPRPRTKRTTRRSSH